MRALQPMSHFAQTILDSKYAHTKTNGNKENWGETSLRVAHCVVNPYLPEYVNQIQELIYNRQLMPAGRYLYAAGRPYPQINNCFLFISEDSREGWADTMYKATNALMTGGGIGNVYTKLRGKGDYVRGLGGMSTGPCSLAQMVNEAGRHIMQGGARRSAIWAGLHWYHPDIFEFITLKDWSPAVQELKRKDFNFPAPLDGTNISVALDTRFFQAYNNSAHEMHKQAYDVYWAVIEHMCKTGEPGFSIDCGSNEGQWARNACVPGETRILTKLGYKAIEELVDTEVEIWNGTQWSTVTPKITGHNQSLLQVSLSDGAELKCTPDHKFIMADGSRIEACELKLGDRLAKCNYPIIDNDKKLDHAYSQGFYTAEGFFNKGYPCVWVYSPKTVCIPRLTGIEYIGKWSSYQNKCHIRFTNGFASKFFVPLDYSVKSKLDWLAGLLDGDATVARTRGASVQLCSINKEFLNEVKLLLTTIGVRTKVSLAQKKSYRSMPDGKGGSKTYLCQDSYRLHIPGHEVAKLIALGLHCERLQLKTAKRDNTRYLKVTGLQNYGQADVVYCFNEPINHAGIFEGVYASNCTEVVSADDCDMCNLASLNMARFDSIDQFEHAVWLATAFLMCGTLYSKLPIERMYSIREKNRRLGLGLMGIHEWLLKRGKQYGPDPELGLWMAAYARAHKYAIEWANNLGVSTPIATRAIAPTGTIAIVAETTSAIEPIFAVAQKRRYLAQDYTATWKYQYIIDACAERIINSGVDPNLIEDAYDLAEDYERRIGFQTWAQQYVDQGISSTINMPSWRSSINNPGTIKRFGNTLLKYLPKLRGITVYPDNARGGQPLNRVPYQEAMKYLGQEFTENGDSVSVEVQEVGNERSCINGVCGI